MDLLELTREHPTNLVGFRFYNSEMNLKYLTDIVALESSLIILTGEGSVASISQLLAQTSILLSSSSLASSDGLEQRPVSLVLIEKLHSLLCSAECSKSWCNINMN